MHVGSSGRALTLTGTWEYAAPEQLEGRGATMVGGCCGCGPQGIRAIRDTVIIRDRRDGSGE